MAWHNGGKTNLWLCFGVLTFFALLCADVNADGPLRRLFRGANRTTTASGYVCENGVCYPATTTATVTRYSVPTVVSSSVATVAAPAVSSTAIQPVSIVEVEGGKFHKAVIQAAIKAQKAGTISRIELVKLRVAMLAPSFRQRAEDLALIQVAASDEESPFTLTDDGTIDRTAIDWDGFAAFLEKLLPLILALLKAFGV